MRTIPSKKKERAVVAIVETPLIASTIFYPAHDTVFIDFFIA